jgi:hypothetical protein
MKSEGLVRQAGESPDRPGRIERVPCEFGHFRCGDKVECELCPGDFGVKGRYAHLSHLDAMGGSLCAAPTALAFRGIAYPALRAGLNCYAPTVLAREPEITVWHPMRL